MRCSTNHISVQLLGGFGNQLFQISHAFTLSARYQRPFMLIPPTHGRLSSLQELGLEPFVWYQLELLNEQLNLTEIDSRCKYIFSKKLEEKSFTYKAVELPLACATISGYFQSYKYFSQIESPLRKWLISRLEITPGVRPSSQVGLHVRLGDMANDTRARNYHGIISDSYVQKALLFLDRDITDLRLVTESVIDLARELPELYAKKPVLLTGAGPVNDFRLLCEFRNLIISNSSFSWWAAWISNSTTVAPSAWFTPQVLAKNPVFDLIPLHWTTL